jgi:hypothetical protein
VTAGKAWGMPSGADRVKHGDDVMFSRDFLLGLRRRAIRRRAWFSLDSLDRGIFNLVTRVVDRVESSVLGAVLVKIVRKLRDAMKSEFVKLMESSGLRMAWESAKRAVEWGYDAAGEWAHDVGFARYHAFLIFYRPSGWGL